MITGQPVDRIAAALAESGYRRLPVPVKLAGFHVDFPAALVGEIPRSDLVLLADSTMEPEQRILRKVEGTARALDVLRSRRSLTTVIVGPRPAPATLQALSRVSRVLPVGQSTDPDFEITLDNWLAVLMPLRLPAPGEQIADPDALLRRAYDGEEALMDELLQVAVDGSGAVRDRLFALVNRIVETSASEDTA
jgi:hypothetical protein